MVGNIANHGYLPGIIIKELLAGRECEVTGSCLIHLKTMDDYVRNKPRLIGKFGEVVNRTNVSFIATREPPEWAREIIHEFIWYCDPMIRWTVPEELR